MSTAPRRGFVAVLAVLLTTGWAANHFVALIPVLRTEIGLSHASLDAMFGIYALGLLPGLLMGGALSDRLGRAAIVLPGAVIAAAGSLVLLSWHQTPGLMIGRLVVGIGAGLAVGAGTAWAADLRGKSGAVLAGVALTSGFALGPLLSGVMAQFVGLPLSTPFIVSAVLSIGAVIAAAKWSVPLSTEKTAPATTNASLGERSVKSALSWSLPLAPWVFASATVSFVIMAAKFSDRYPGPLLPGLAAATTLGSGLGIQTAARHFNWGPHAGTVGAAAAAIGYALVAAGGANPSLALFAVCAVVLGVGYGLSLREGLLDLESLAPSTSRGTLTGIFYVVAYLGFGLPLLLVFVEPAMGPRWPMVVLALLAAAAAASRFLRLRRTTPVHESHPRLVGAST